MIQISHCQLSVNREIINMTESNETGLTVGELYDKMCDALPCAVQIRLFCYYYYN